MTTILPAWPHLLFAVLEPISVTAGWFVTVTDPQYAIASQHPDSTLQQTQPVEMRMVAHQLGNVYLLLGMVGIAVLYSTSEPKVVRNYFIALALGDVGHLYMTYLGLGGEYFFGVSGWNAMSWGNIGVTAFLLVNRLAYFLGLFGSANVPPPAGKKAE